MVVCHFFFFKQKTAYEMRISDWSSDVCSSDLRRCSRTTRAPTGSASVHSHSVRASRWKPLAWWCGMPPPRSIPGLTGSRRSHSDESARARRRADRAEIGRASCRERVCQYVEISVVAVSLKKKQQDKIHI